MEQKNRDLIDEIEADDQFREYRGQLGPVVDLPTKQWQRLVSEHRGLLAAREQLADQQAEIDQLRRDLDEARQLARDIWQRIPTAAKVEIFEKSDGWVPAWVRPAAQ